MEIKLNNTVITIASCNNNPVVENKDYLFEVVCAWKSVIYSLVQGRLSACKNNLANNLSRIDSANEYTICYHTESGNSKHYSAPAAQAMQMILDNILEHPEHIVNDHMCLLQITKALYWASDFNRSCVKNGYSFDDLYSLILCKLTR